MNLIQYCSGNENKEKQISNYYSTHFSYIKAQKIPGFSNILHIQGKSMLWSQLHTGIHEKKKSNINKHNKADW